MAPSFIRFGHFEHFAARQLHDELGTAADYVIDRYYPACRDSTPPSHPTFINIGPISFIS